MSEYFLVIDKIRWWIAPRSDGSRVAQPLCPYHNLRLYPVYDTFAKPGSLRSQDKSHTLKCAECLDYHKLTRSLEDQRRYVLDKADSTNVFKNAKYINLDDEAVPIAEDKAKTKDGRYFVTARFMESKVGKRLVVLVGERGNSTKSQIFVEPEIRRLAFDQSDIHPADIFTKLEAFFSDGSTASIMNNEEDDS